MTMGEPKLRKPTLLKLGDYWGSVLLNRLNHFYKTEQHCDLTLRLSTAQVLKVHRAILHACTDYFDSILSPEMTFLDLDESFPAEVMILIVKFMYTGQVENVTAETYAELHKMAGILRMTILVDHLDAAHKQGMNFNETLGISPLNEVLKPVVTNDNSAPKRLAIWTRKPVPIVNPVKKQTNANTNCPLVLSSNTMIRFVLSKPVPTRFEYNALPNEDFPISVVGDALSYMSYENDSPLVQPLILDESTRSRPSPAKRPREGSDLTNMKEFGQQQKIRNELMMEEDEEDVDDPAECSPTEISPKPILKSFQRGDTETPKRVRFQDGSQEAKPADQTYIPVATIALPEPKVDRVEYAGSGELLVTSQSGRSDLSKRVQYSVMPGVRDPLSESDNTVDNPAKIVSEVLKKYPDLVTGRRKNIKLKVMTNATTEGSTAAKYILIKDAGTATVKSDYSHEWNPENQEPWICTPCGKDGPLNFESYELFRKHITTVHNIVISPKICEYCGSRVPSVGHMPYHLYAKHKVKPLMPEKYPKCTLCDHISFSPNLLLRHMEIEHGDGQYSCKTCNVSFKSQVLFTSHMRSDWHLQCESQQGCDYPCPFCDDEFIEATQLKSHIEAQHQKKEKEDEEEAKTDEENEEFVSPENITQNELIIDAPELSEETEILNEKSQGEDEVGGGEEETEEEEQLVSELVEEVAPVFEEKEIAGEVSQEQSSPAEQQLVVIPEEAIEMTEEVEEVAEEMEKDIIEEAAEQTETLEAAKSPSIAVEEFPQSDEPPTMENSQEYEENESESAEMEISHETETETEQVPVLHEEEKIDFQGEKSFSADPANNESYEAMEIGEPVLSQDMATDVEAECEEIEEAADCEEIEEAADCEEVEEAAECEEVEETAEVEQQIENREGHADHDYAPYNSMVMFQPNMVLPPRVMLVTHPGMVFMPGPSIITDQIVLPYPQCAQVQMVNNGQVVTTTAQVVTTNVPTECVQVVRERKIEPETLANDWDESNQTETPSVLPPGVGPSRAEFF